MLIALHVQLLLVKGSLRVHSKEAGVFFIAESSSFVLLKLMSIDNRLVMLFRALVQVFASKLLMLSSTDSSLVMAPLNGLHIISTLMVLRRSMRFHSIMVTAFVIMEIIIETSHPVRHSLVGPTSLKESAF